MFRWYRAAARCYVYLSDVSTGEQSAEFDHTDIAWETAFRRRRWFTRGWTLQELLAPNFVHFFSREGNMLGDKISLKRSNSRASRIPDAALEGTPLYEFTVNERLSWSEHRNTKIEEDKAYSLIGIFGVDLSPFYGEGRAGYFQRLMNEVDKLKSCLETLRSTDPYDDKKRIQEMKGGLLENSFRWVLEDHNYQRWFNSDQNRMLWIKGDPGKGKTMLICGILTELLRSKEVSFFFCQATDSRINSATAILRALIHTLVRHQPVSASHLLRKYEQAAGSISDDANAWTALSGVFVSMVEDTNLREVYLVIDALDECVVDLPKLLHLIVRTSNSPKVKWLVTSRNDASREQRFSTVNDEARVDLELKENVEHVSLAVHWYIDHKLARLEITEDALKEEI